MLINGRPQGFDGKTIGLLVCLGGGLRDAVEVKLSAVEVELLSLEPA